MSEVKDFFHILFFLVMGCIAILSYFQAKKTLFSPIRTEIFKIQMEEIKSVLAFFNKQSAADFDREFGIRETFEINSFRMHHAYIENFFSKELEPDKEYIKRLGEMSYGAIISAKNLREITAGSELGKTEEEEEEELSPAIKLAQWQKYELPAVEYSKGFHEKQEELKQLAASPLLPKELTDMLYEFHAAMNKNLFHMQEAITECAQQLPVKYPTAQDNIKFRPDWIWNIYNRKKEETDEISAKILRFINSHLKIDELV